MQMLEPATGKPLKRDTRPLTITYKGISITVDMPGWYSEDTDYSVHEGDDMKIYDEAITVLKQANTGV